MFDIDAVRKDFPILAREIRGHPLVYLDSAASAQKPRAVLDVINNAYSREYANVHRGLHFLSGVATDKYEEVRCKIKSFINAAHDDEIIYTGGSTESINMVAYSWALPRLKEGDEILLSALEHHANIVPWHFLRERLGVQLVWIEPEQDGVLDPQRVADAMSPKTRLLALSHMSNVLGTRIDIKAIAALAREKGVPILADGSQSTVHGPIDVQDLGVDFFALTGHKLYGPTASGALYAKRRRLQEMRPFMGGGDMIREVTRSHVTYAEPPLMLEAGTPAIVQMIGLGAAIDYVSALGMENIARHEADIAAYAAAKLADEPWIIQQGTAPGKAAIFSFTLAGPAHPHDVSTILDQQGIAVRAGHHCAQPLMSFFRLTATCRASFGLYSTIQEVDRLLEGLHVCRDMLG
ncbi:MAG: SufS family cysteine desulfurase [Rhodobacteraceae bacterium]|nr:SufS family cysteine desulfurase [Paracoccaceae bacterium]